MQDSIFERLNFEIDSERYSELISVACEIHDEEILDITQDDGNTENTLQAPTLDTLSDSHWWKDSKKVKSKLLNQHAYDRKKARKPQTAVKVGIEKKHRKLSLYGDVIIHPIKLKRIKKNKGILLKESKTKFVQAIAAFVKHYAKYRCSNSKIKSYKTKCNCLANLLYDTNSSFKINQISQSILSYFCKEKEYQNEIMKGWIEVAQNRYRRKKSCYSRTNLTYELPEVFHDAPNNKEKYFVCQNAFMLLFNYGHHKFRNLKQSHNVIPSQKKGETSNTAFEKQAVWDEVDKNLHIFFRNLKAEAILFSTRNKIEGKKLPPTYSKDRLYCNYVLLNGIITSKGSSLSKKMNQIVPSRYYFGCFRMKHYPDLRIE